MLHFQSLFNLIEQKPLPLVLFVKGKYILSNPENKGENTIQPWLFERHICNYAIVSCWNKQNLTIKLQRETHTHMPQALFQNKSHVQFITGCTIINLMNIRQK